MKHGQWEGDPAPLTVGHLERIRADAHPSRNHLTIDLELEALVTLARHV